jgi:hypothetical protein
MARLALLKAAPAIAAVNALRTGVFRFYARQLFAFAAMLRDDPELKTFHEGASRRVPRYYLDRFDRRLGRYAELISIDERLAMSPSDKEIPQARETAAHRLSTA